MARLFRRSRHTCPQSADGARLCIIAVVVAGVLGVARPSPRPLWAQQRSSASTAQHTSPHSRPAPTATSTGQPASAAQRASTAGQATRHPAGALPAGSAAVPGIGDIGGLLGFCNAGSSGLIGDLNNICQPSVPAPEPANGGIDSLIKPPADRGQGRSPTLYDSYGMAGQSWAAYDLQCSDMTSLIGNNVAGMVFDAAKALDRVTITVYQSAAGEGILVLADQRGGPADHQPGQRDLLPLPGRRWSSSARSGWPGRA